MLSKIGTLLKFGEMAVSAATAQLRGKQTLLVGMVGSISKDSKRRIEITLANAGIDFTRAQHIWSDPDTDVVMCSVMGIPLQKTEEAIRALGQVGLTIAMRPDDFLTFIRERRKMSVEQVAHLESGTFYGKNFYEIVDAMKEMNAQS